MLSTGKKRATLEDVFTYVNCLCCYQQWGWDRRSKKCKNRGWTDTYASNSVVVPLLSAGCKATRGVWRVPRSNAAANATEGEELLSARCEATHTIDADRLCDRRGQSM